MWHSSPSPKYSRTSSGHWFASASSSTFGIVRVDQRAQLLQHRVRLGQVLVVGAFALDEVGNRIEPKAVDAHVEPEAHDAEDRLAHLRIVEVEVGLMAEEAVPVVRLGDLVPGPVRLLGVGEDDARAAVLVRVVAPDVVVALARALGRAARRLEPRMLVRRVVDDQLGDDPQPAAVRLAHEMLEVVARPVAAGGRCGSRRCRSRRPQRRRIERQQPDRVDAEVLDVVELLRQPAEVADAVVVGVEERLDVQLVDDRVLVPVDIRRLASRRRGRRSAPWLVRPSSSASEEVVEIVLGAHAMTQAEDVGGDARGIEHHEIARAVSTGSAAPVSRSCTWNVRSASMPRSARSRFTQPDCT